MIPPNSTLTPKSSYPYITQTFLLTLWMNQMDNTIIPANAHRQRCPRCQSPLHTVVVHGIVQCVTCKSNIFECCSGDTCETDHNLSVGYKRG